MIDSRNRNTAALFRVTPSPDDGKQELIYANDKADVSGAMVNPDSRDVEAVESEYLRSEWTILSDAIRRDFEALAKLDRGDFEVTSRSRDDSKWVVIYRSDLSPARWWLWDRKAGKGVYLGAARPALASKPLQPMLTVEIPARDGLTLPSYLTLPSPDAKNAPMVLMVHGGPWARDSWGYNPYHQWLANRGYAVLGVNFRGSTGFGKDFLNAGNREWFAKMQDDLNDAVEWAIKKGYADPNRVAIMGGSYGGYATLAGLTRDPELFACGVDIVGPSHIRTLLQSIPPYWEPLIAMFETRVGALSEPDFLDTISPLTHVERIQRPLLIGQGANDPRVKVHESDQIVEAMKRHQLPVTYVVFPDEGHGFARPDNNMAFNAITEAFLAKHIGGRAEPVGDDVKKSTAQVRELGGLNLPNVPVWTPSASP
ncbi:MAG: S9 family peptidase [Phycisphaeraceae bacterium]|nr:S9 family peptidase [Phycisphaeraceae bacterium]